MNDADVIFAILVSLPVGELSMRQIKTLSAPFRISETNLRSTLSRLHKLSILEIRKEGRNAYYRLGERGRRIGQNVGRHFDEPDWSSWDGRYWAAAFSFPNTQARYRIQKKLAAYRFRTLYPGLWVRPLHPDEKVQSVFADAMNAGGFDLVACTFVQGLSSERVRAIYDLDSVMSVLAAAKDAAEESIAKAAEMSPREAFTVRIELGDRLVDTLTHDPLLPPVVLPEEWPGPALRKAFHKWNRVYAGHSASFVKRALEL